MITENGMPVGPEQEVLNPFAAELRRAAGGAAAPDKAPSLRELSKVSGVGRSAIGDWLAGRSLPRSWDDSAVLVVDAIIKLAARYGKRFPDEEAVRQRCKDAYARAKRLRHSNDPSGSPTATASLDVTVVLTDAAPPSADDVPEPGSVSGVRSVVSLLGAWRKYATWAVAIFTTLTVATVVPTLLWWSTRQSAPPPVPDPLSIGVPLHPTPLSSAKSDKCVTVDGDDEQTQAFQFSCTGAPGRTWYLQPVSGDPNIYLFHTINTANRKCLSYSDEFFGGAHVVVQISCATGRDEGQIWSFILEPSRGDGWTYGRLVNMHSSQCLDINGESVDDGTPVIQWYCGDKLNQLFKITK
jgi:hypothetical protein